MKPLQHRIIVLILNHTKEDIVMNYSKNWIFSFFILLFSVYFVFPNNRKEYIKQFLPENPIILEAGAHNGSDTVEMARIFPGSQIYAFEPLPSLFNQLSQKTKDLSNIKCYRLALSSKPGKARFYICEPNNGASSLLEPSHLLLADRSLHFNSIIEVEAITLDDWAHQEGIPRIDFMWLDMQGSEPEVLMASQKIFDTVKVVYTEVNYKPLYEGAILYPEFKNWMQSKGFKIVSETPGYPGQGDVLFVRS